MLARPSSWLYDGNEMYPTIFTIPDNHKTYRSIDGDYPSPRQLNCTPPLALPTTLCHYLRLKLNNLPTFRCVINKPTRFQSGLFVHQSDIER